MPPPARAGGRRSGASRCLPAAEGAADRGREGLLDFSHSFGALGERQGTLEAEGTEGRVALELRLGACASAGLTLGRTEVGAPERVG